jgi:hypothetical protein
MYSAAERAIRGGGGGRGVSRGLDAAWRDVKRPGRGGSGGGGAPSAMRGAAGVSGEAKLR